MARQTDPTKDRRTAEVVRLPVVLGPRSAPRAGRPAYAAAPFLAQLIASGLARRGLAMPRDEADDARLRYRTPARLGREPGGRLDRRI